MPSFLDKSNANFACAEHLYTNEQYICNSIAHYYYSGFTVSGDVYYTLLRIPEYSIQQNYIPATHGSIIFIPKDVLGLNSYLGYLWNPLTSTVISTALNDDLVEDHIDNSTAYIVVVDFDEISTSGSGSRNASNCEGGWTCTDGYCDSICGETQSCFDCNKLYNKRLVLKDILINDDIRVTGGANGTVANKHFVSVLGGKYKIGLNAVVLHANGKFDAINGMRIKEKWNKNQVKRTRVKSPSKSVSRGTPTWQAVHLKDEPNQSVLLSNHFNIYQAKIYINMYEIDAPFGSKHDFDAPVFNGFGINNSQFWRSSTMTSLTGPDKWYYYQNSTQNPVVWALTDAVEEILPNRWIDPSGALLDEIEVNRANVKFILKVYNK